MWTNASSFGDRDEGMIDVALKRLDREDREDIRQARTRLSMEEIGRIM
jgi:hypothetical protein